MNDRLQNPPATLLRILIALLIAVGAGIVGYKFGMRAGTGMAPKHLERAVAILSPTEGSEASGTVIFERVTEGIRVHGRVENLEPGPHGFHIHEFGDPRAPDGTSAGDHFAPLDQSHGGPGQENSHVGDLGNIEAGDDSVAEFDFIDRDLAFSGRTSILGRGVVVHGGQDDLTSQPSGAAGPRVALGVVGVTESPKVAKVN